MKKLLLSAAALCCFASAQAQWTTIVPSSPPASSAISTLSFGPAKPANALSAKVGIGTEGTREPVTTLDLGNNFSEPGTFPNKISLYWQANNNYYGFGVSPGNVDYFTAANHRFFSFDAGGIRREVFNIQQSGNVGIGTNNPTHRLQVHSGSAASHLGFGLGRTTNEFTIGVAASGGQYAWDAQAGDVVLRTEDAAKKLMLQTGGGATALTISSNNVTVGTPAPTGTRGNYKLDVWGAARANEIVVNTSGADFVFADDYRLRPLKEVEQFINTNNHLPEIPSAKEMQQNGMAVGELQTKLLQKVEELTLYVIEQQKQLQELKQENQELKEKVQKLK